jgi:hypothetical protein
MVDLCINYGTLGQYLCSEVQSLNNAPHSWSHSPTKKEKKRGSAPDLNSKSSLQNAAYSHACRAVLTCFQSCSWLTWPCLSLSHWTHTTFPRKSKKRKPMKGKFILFLIYGTATWQKSCVLLFISSSCPGEIKTRDYTHAYISGSMSAR